MYCSCCGNDCVIPEGMEADALGCITNKATNEIKVIRCVECINRYGMGDPNQIYVCIRKPIERR